MRVITAPDSTDGCGPSVFLAGGITDCSEWQATVISLLSKYSGAVLLNPRRANFPINDPDATYEQIKWEFDALNRASVFSIWFCNSKSDQPICMYELGRHLVKFPTDKVIIGIEPGYRREQDVRIQTKLANPYAAARITDNLHDHAHAIYSALWDV